MALTRPFAAYSGPGLHVFVCYAHADAQIVYPEIAILHERGVNVWYDEGIEIGHEWRAEIAAALDKASTVLFYQSKASVRSKQCVREISYALDRDVPIVRVDLKGTELPPGLRLGLETEQAINAKAYSPDEYMEKLFGALLEPSIFTSAKARKTAPLRNTRSLISVTIGFIVILFAATAWWYNPLHRGGVQSLPLTSIAVLPFDDLSPGGNQAWLANGMAEDLIESLSRIEGLRVPNRRATMRLKQEGATIQAIGDSLAVGSVVIGSIQRSADELVVTAQWIRVEDQSLLWSGRYQETLEDVFSIQKLVAIEIAEALRTELGIVDSYEDFMSTRYDTTDVRAYELVRKSADLDIEWTFGSSEAGALIRQAIVIDPRYAAAHGALAIHLWLKGAKKKAVESARLALELDPHDIHANYVMALHSIDSWNFDAAEQRILRVVAAAPHQSTILYAYIYLLQSTGRVEEALKQAQRLLEMEGDWAVSDDLILGVAYLGVGDYTAALEVFEAIPHDRMPPDKLTDVAFAYQQNGRHDDAMEFMVRALQEYEEDIRTGFDAGGWEGLNLALAEALPVEVCPAILYAMANKRDQMYECLEINLIETEPSLPAQVNASAAFSPYRSEKRFQALLSEVNARAARVAATN